MKKVYSLLGTFCTEDISKEELKKRLCEEIDKAYEEDKEDAKVYDDFIKSIIDMAISAVNDKEFTPKAELLKETLLTRTVDGKRSFYFSYRTAIADSLEEIIDLAMENEMLKAKKPSLNEKSDIKRDNHKKTQNKAKGA